MTNSDETLGAIYKSIDGIVRAASKKWDDTYSKLENPSMDREALIATTVVEYIRLLGDPDDSAINAAEKAVETPQKIATEIAVKTPGVGRVTAFPALGAGSVSKFKLTTNGKTTKMFAQAGEGTLSYSYWVTIHGNVVEEGPCENLGFAIERLNYWHNMSGERPERAQKKQQAKPGVKSYLRSKGWLG